MPSWLKSSTTRTTASYIADYAIVFGLIGLFVVVDKITPFHQRFSLDNYTLQYPYAVHERIPVPLLLVICYLAPFLIMAFYTIVIDGLLSKAPKPGQTTDTRLRGPYTAKQRLWQCHMAFLGLSLAISAAFTITGSLKSAVGKPRPDLIDRCQPAAGSANGSSYGLSDISICTQTDDHILQDGFKSFPSGHSSCGFAGLYFLSLFLAGKLHILDSYGQVWKGFVVLVPTLAAALVASSRIMDARHHPFDVLSGALIGILVAWGAYRVYFPALSEFDMAGRAYDKRRWGDDITTSSVDNVGSRTSSIRMKTGSVNYGRAQEEGVIRTQQMQEYQQYSQYPGGPVPPPASAVPSRMSGLNRQQSWYTSTMGRLTSIGTTPTTTHEDSSRTTDTYLPNGNGATYPPVNTYDSASSHR